MSNAVIILEHRGSENDDHPALQIASVVQRLLINEDSAREDEQSSLVLLVEFSKLLNIRYDDEKDKAKSNDQIFAEESLKAEYGKRIEKRVVRFLERLCLRDATIVAHGTCCPFALKLLRPSTSRSLAKENQVKRLVLLHPVISPAFINRHLLDKTFAKRLQRVEMLCAYTASQKRRRDPVLRHYCPRGKSITWEPEVSLGSMHVLVPMLRGVDPEAKVEDANEVVGGKQHTDAKYEYDNDLYDTLGRRVYFSELTIVMEPTSKIHVQISEEITYEEMKFAAAIESTTEAESYKDADESIAMVEDCVKEYGALLLRGNRIVLCRSLDDDDPTVMRIPSSVPDDDEDPVDCAMRSIEEMCDIEDPADHVLPLPHLPPMRLFRPRGTKKIVDVFFFYAKSPPPSENMSNDEDYEDAYDWYTLPFAVRALERNGDIATSRFLKGLAYTLSSAVSTNAIERKWGGMFGEDLFVGDDDDAEDAKCA